MEGGRREERVEGNHERTRGIKEGGRNERQGREGGNEKGEGGEGGNERNGGEGRREERRLQQTEPQIQPASQPKQPTSQYNPASLTNPHSVPRGILHHTHLSRTHTVTHLTRTQGRCGRGGGGGGGPTHSFTHSLTHLIE